MSDLTRFKSLAKSYGAALLYAPESDSDPLENLGSLSLPDGSLENGAILYDGLGTWTGTAHNSVSKLGARRNYVPNPILEGGAVTPWDADSGESLSITAEDSRIGSHCLQLENTADNFGRITSEVWPGKGLGMPVTAGQTVYVKLSSKAVSTSAGSFTTLGAAVRFLGDEGEIVQQTTLDSQSNPALGTWYDLEGSVVVPEGATYVLLMAYYGGSEAADHVWRIDRAYLSDQDGSFFPTPEPLVNGGASAVLDGSNDYIESNWPTWTNVIHNPVFGNEINGWGGFGGPTVSFEEEFGAVPCLKCVTDGEGGVDGIGLFSEYEPAVQGGETYTAILLCKAPNGRDMSLWLDPDVGSTAIEDFESTGGLVPQAVAVEITLDGEATKANFEVRVTEETATTFRIYGTCLVKASIAELEAAYGSIRDAFFPVGTGMAALYDFFGAERSQLTLDSGLAGFSGEAHNSPSDAGPFARGTERTFVMLHQRAEDPDDTALVGGSGPDEPLWWVDEGGEVDNIRWSAQNLASFKTWSGAGPAIGVTQMAALAFSDPDDTVTLYTDGQLVNQQAETAQFAGQGAGTMKLGARLSSSNPYTGKLLPFAVFTKELSDWQVSELHRAAFGLPAYSRVAVTQEYPPDRLAWHVNPPGGAPNRWASDEPDPANVIDDINLDSEMNGGYTQATGVLPRDPHHEYSDLAPYADISIYGPGVEEVWNGRLEKGSEESGERQQIKVECAGWWNALEDDKGLSLGFIDQELSKWGDSSTERRLRLIEAGIRLMASTSVGHSSEAPEAVAPSIINDFTNVETVASDTEAGEAVYASGGVDIGRALYDFLGDLAKGDASANWENNLILGKEDTFVTFAEGTDHNAAAATQQSVTAPGEGYHYARVRDRLAAASEGISLKRIFAWRPLILSLLAHQNLALQGEWPDVGYTAKQMLQLAVPLFASPLRATDESMEDDEFVIPQAWYSEPGPLSEVVNDLTKYGLLRWFVYEDKLFQLRFRENFGRTWIIRSGTSGLEEVGIDAQRLWRSLSVRWQDVAGDTRTAGPPGSGAEVEDARLEVTDPQHPAVLANLTRRDVLNLGGVATAEPAIAAGARWLEEANQLNRSGQAELVGYVEDDKAVMRPASQVRAGDKVIVADSGDRSPREITSCSYTHRDRKAVVSLDAPAQSVQALLERYGASLTSLGVG